MPTLPSSRRQYNLGIHYGHVYPYTIGHTQPSYYSLFHSLANSLSDMKSLKMEARCITVACFRFWPFSLFCQTFPLPRTVISPAGLLEWTKAKTGNRIG